MEDSLAARLSKIVGDAESLAETIRTQKDPPLPERTRRRAHRLRETLGVALIMSEMLARETGNGPMVEMRGRPDGAGDVLRVCPWYYGVIHPCPAGITSGITGVPLGYDPVRQGGCDRGDMT
jgi:hypothetical protein